MSKILLAIHYCFYIYMVMILVRCLLTWFPAINWENSLVRIFTDSVDIYLDIFRKFIPPLGMFDLSPIVAMIVLMFLERLCLYGAAFFMSVIGLGA